VVGQSREVTGRSVCRALGFVPERGHRHEERGKVTILTSRAGVGPFRAQEGMGSAAGMYKS
jgi:hypothetical protein